MKKYWRHAALAIQETIAYRVSYLVNIFGNAVFYVVIFMVWNAVYRGNPLIAGFDWESMKGYLIVSLCMSALVAGSSEFRISRQIRSGNIIVELLRPVDYQKATLAITVGNALSEGLVVVLFGLVFALVAGLTRMPADLATWLLFIVSVLLSFLTKFLIVYVFSLVCFWTTSLMGVSWLRRGLTDFFSGALIPLSFFPDWLRTLADWLPFRSIVYVPASIFIGRLQGRELWLVFAQNLIWIVALWFLAKLVWSIAMRRVTIQGG